MTWHEDAKCLGMDTELFVMTEAPEGGREQAAIKLCRGCPVWEACARDAIREGAVGIVRAGVYLPMSGPAARRRLTAVLDAGHMPSPYEKKTQVIKPGTGWRGTCSECGVKMRAASARLDDYPDTKPAAKKGLCRGCHALTVPVVPCSGCERPMRDAHAPAHAFPGTVQCGGKNGVCRECAAKTQQEKEAKYE